MVVKVYISGISGNKEVKKRQQRVLMILDAKHITYEIVDITEPGKEGEKDFMQNNSTSPGATVSDTTPRHPLPPQMFSDGEYCGDYDQFDLANEIDTLEQFLKVEVPAEKNVEEIKEVTTSNIEEAIEKIASNGITSSREASVEGDTKSNGTKELEDEVNDDAEEEKEEDDATEVVDLKKDLTPSEDLIQSEQEVAE